jgi:glycosyltransferase involved in cell wall biosynthesis
MERVTVIIPAFNEEATVGCVVSAVKDSPLVERVVVVSDGSTDATVMRAKEAGGDVIELPERCGKGHALYVGVEAAQTEFVIFLDADLYGIGHKHVALLAEPVLQGKAMMSIGLRDRGTVLVTLMRLLPFVSGERCLPRNLFLSCLPEDLLGYRVEVAINTACKRAGGRIVSVLLPGVRIRTKVAKVGWKRGLWQYVRMWAQVTAAWVASLRRRR